MVVRVRLRIRSLDTGRSTELRVLVNSGAESERPLVAVTPNVAEKLGLWSPREVHLAEVEQAVGVSEVYIIPQSVKISLITEEGEELSEVPADLAVQEGLWESFITDATIDALGIQVVKFKEGLWRHVNDPPGLVRESVTLTLLLQDLHIWHGSA